MVFAGGPGAVHRKEYAVTIGIAVIGGFISSSISVSVCGDQEESLNTSDLNINESREVRNRPAGNYTQIRHSDKSCL